MFIQKQAIKFVSCEITGNPLVSSATIFQNDNLPVVSRSTRCQDVRDFVKVKNAEMTTNHKLKCGEIHEDCLNNLSV